MLFCDLIGSTALFGALDPEDVGLVLRSHLRRCAERIEAGGGFVAQFQGDGVLGFFGYAEASESSAEQAVWSALQIVEAAQKSELPHGHPAQVRVGISTGLAVVGDPSGEGTRLEQGAVGETLHLAARLQGLAGPNQVVVAESTRRLTGSLFRYGDLGRFSLKGFAEPVQTWRVLGPRPSLSHFKLRRNPVLAQLVGRDAEVEHLIRLWRKSMAGQGQIVSIVAEAGIGKSRLINEFRHRIARERHLWLEGGGALSFRNTPFYAVAQAIRRVLDPIGRASSAELRGRLERGLERSGIRLGEVLPFVTELLELPGADAVAPAIAVPGERRNRLFSRTVDWLRATARHRPVVIVADDLQWLDPSSLELIGHIVQSIEDLPVLMLHATRPDFRPSWPTPEYSTQLNLSRLSDNDLRRLVMNSGRARILLTGEDVSDVVHRAEGVPLFGIELARFVGENPGRSAAPHIPSTLADLLAARLDQLGPAKRIAQIAAVIGDEIPVKLLEGVSGISLSRLRPHLRALMKGGVLQKAAADRKSVLTFSHSLLREAAYDALLRSDLHGLHRRTAEVISEQFGAIAESRPELLAYHLTNAGESARASAAWQQAGDLAASRRAYAEAEQAYRNAISALLRLSPSPDREATELALQSALVDTLQITRGYSAQQTVIAATRARLLADRNGDRQQRIQQMLGAWTAASSGGDHREAIRLAKEFYRLAVADGSADSLALAHMIQMTSRYRGGDLIGAENHFIRGGEFFAASEFRQRPGAIAQTYGNAARIAWILGDDAAAQRRIDHAVTAARDGNNPYDLASAEYMHAIHAVLLEQYELASEVAENSIRLSDKHEFPQFAAISRVVLGRAQVGLGFSAEGTKLIREGLTRMGEASVRVALTLYLTWLAEALLASGALDQALRAVEDALRINTQELFFRPETIRLRGEVRHRTGSADQAEADFLEAIGLANKMGAKRFRHHAATSLQRLLDRYDMSGPVVSAS